MNDSPETEYVKMPDGVYIAYQAVGDGPTDFVFDFNPDESNVDLMWAEPDWEPFLTGATTFGRVIVHDRRGLGVSSRNVPPANLETRVSDLLAVLDAVGSERPILTAGSDTGAMFALFAATHPDRVTGLLWNNPVARTAWAPDYPWGQGQEEFEREMRLSDLWGTTEYSRVLAEFREAERIGRAAPHVLRTGIERPPLSDYGRINRNTATPDVAREIARITWDTDVRAILPSVHAPVVLVTGTQDRPDEAAYIASLMPNATVHTVPGRSGIAHVPILELLRRMAGADAPAPELETVLATVLFTDIVESTSTQAALGDRGWRDLVHRHHAMVRESLRRWRGTENDTAGDGFYATFDGPARAIRFARSRSSRESEPWTSRSARACTRVNASCSTESTPASLCQSAHESHPKHALRRCSCRRPSGIWLQDRASRLQTRVSMSSRAFPVDGGCTARAKESVVPDARHAPRPPAPPPARSLREST